MTRQWMKMIPTEPINIFPSYFSQCCWWYGPFISQTENHEYGIYELLLSISSTTWKSLSVKMASYFDILKEVESRAQKES